MMDQVRHDAQMLLCYRWFRARQRAGKGRIAAPLMERVRVVVENRGRFTAALRCCADSKISVTTVSDTDTHALADYDVLFSARRK